MTSYIELESMQACAFRRITLLMQQDLSVRERDERTMAIVEQLTTFVARHNLNIGEQLALLQANRHIRLPNTQFAYWPHRHDPRMIFADGHEEYVRGRMRASVINTKGSIAEQLAEQEEALFSTPDRSVVWWRGWKAVISEDGYPILFCDYSLTHIWDDDVHHESRAECAHQKTHTYWMNDPEQRRRLEHGVPNIDFFPSYRRG